MAGMTAGNLRTTALVLAAGLLMLIAGSPAPADAAFPGRPGLIAFEHRDRPRGETEIWVSRGRDAPVRALTRNRVHDQDPTFSPNGRLIAFTSWRDGGGIFVMRPNGSRVRRITPEPPPRGSDVMYSWSDPAFSANGRWVAFTETRYGSDFESTYIVRMNLDGSGRRIIANNARAPVLSPNGRIMAFNRNSGIWTARVDGTRERPFATRSFSYGPDFSPNGRWIVFSTSARCNTEGRRAYGLVAKRPDKSRSRKVLVKCGQEFVNPAFSPNGGVIVFQRGSDQDRGARPSLGETVFNRGGLPFGGAPDPTGPFNADPSWQPLPRR
jgi:Tol biopolymer transport system component